MVTRSVEVNTPPVGGGGEGRTLRWRRAAKLGLALGLAALLVGDRGALTASTVQGIDPLDILNLQVKPNVLFVIDSSANMGFTPDHEHYAGGDDLRSKFHQTKQAVREVVRSNDGRANFGIIDLSADLNSVALNYNGPLVYASADAAAAIWANSYFDKISTTPSTYDYSLCGGGPNIACSRAVFESFGTELTPPGMTNPPGKAGFNTPYLGFHFIQSRLFRNNVRFTFDATATGGAKQDSLTVITPITCTPPPPGILGDDTDPANDGTEPRPCFELEDSATGDLVRYYYSSGTFYDTGAAAPGVVVPVPACNAASNLTALNSALKLEMPIDPADPEGAPLGLNKVSVDFTVSPDNQPNTAGGGMRLGQKRGLGDALQVAQDHFNNVVFAARPGAVVGLQKNFVILISGGDSNTGANPVTVAASMFAQAGGNKIETLVVSFNGNRTPPFDPVNLNAIQSAGSGGARPIVFGAGTPDMLKASLNYAFSVTIASGTFSTESSITESIFEYAALAGAFDPSDPATRYGGRVPIILQSSFDMPGFNGHLKAFVNSGGSSLLLWDAGQKLRDRVWNGPSGDGMCPGAATFTACNVPLYYYRFDQLRGAEPTSPLFTPTGLIKRRIFTSQGNGVFPYSDFTDSTFTPSTRQQPVPVWPPTATGASPVAPNDPTDPAGALDVPLGIANLSLLQLQSQFLACLGGFFPAGHPCQDANPAVVLARARREAREIILAYTAGAAVAQDANGLPLRDPNPINPPGGSILYRAKDWILPESTLAVPAVVPPPLEARPLAHTAEYNLYRDGIRDSAGNVLGSPTVAQGFGLRNPDKNTSPPLGSDPNYKPIMSVVYHATNDMLHAFRAGACPSSTCTNGRTETGGEELWGFVPYDQLGKLRERLQGQGRVPHTYVLGTSVRFTDVFVPDASGFTISGRLFDGRWRTLLLIGRGIAGKNYTSLDITTPERFNRSSLDTYPAFPIWSRGNPDTQDGTPTGAANSLTDPSGDEGADDATAYATMGETWSVPAVVAVKANVNFDKEYVAFAGSGFNDDATASPVRGKTFYVIDAVTGDVLHSNPLPSSIPNTTTDGDTTGTCQAPLLAGEVCPVPNALVANPSAYVASQLAPGFVGNPSSSTASLVYMGDLHGRMWKYIVDSPSLGMIRMWDSGPDQPIAASVALLNLGGVPHVYYESGNERRVFVPPNFRMYALQDNTGDKLNTRCDTAEDQSGALVNCGGTDKLFRFDFENAFAGYRGTAQPASAFNAQKLGRVFFVGTKFNDQDVSGGNCLSNFDSVLFAVGAQTGGAVYDLDASGTIGANEREIKIGGTKVNAVRGAMGQIVLDRGEIGNTVPSPPPAPAPAPNTNLGSSGTVIVDKQKIGSAICR